MATVVTINRPDVVALIEKAAKQFTAGNKTALVAMAVACLLEHEDLKRPLYGAHPNAIGYLPGVDPFAPAIAETELDAFTKPWAANLPSSFNDSPSPHKARKAHQR